MLCLIEVSVVMIVSFLGLAGECPVNSGVGAAWSLRVWVCFVSLIGDMGLL